MGKRGPAPKPRELRVLEGNPSKRPLPEPVVVDTKLTVAPDAPAELPAEASRLWRDLSPVLVRAHLLDSTNLLSLYGLCVAWDRAMKAQAEIEAGAPLTTHGPQGGVIENPIYAIERKSWAEVRRWAVEFGLTPSARTRLGLMNVAGLTLAQQLEAPADDEIRTEYELPDDFHPSEG